MAFKRATTLTIGDHTVTIDAEDKERVEAHQWRPSLMNNHIGFVRKVIIDRQQYEQPLQQFLLFGDNACKYVELIDRSVKGQFDLRKRNLRAARG